MQRAQGLDVEWLDAAQAADRAVTLAPTGHRGGSFIATDGAIDPPRNVRAYSLAMQAGGVDLRERTAVHPDRDRTGRGRRHACHRRRDRRRHHRDRARPADRRPEPARRRAAGRASGSRSAPPGTRVAVLEPHPAFDVDRLPMVFDIGAGLYWRLEERGLLFGWSDPDEIAGRGAPDRLGLLRRDARPARRVRPGHDRSRPPADLGRDDRLHARPPADPRARSRRRRTTRSRA